MRHSRLTNSEAQACIRAGLPFENTSRTLLGFTDVDGKYGVLSYGVPIMYRYPDGRTEFAVKNRNVYGAHLDLVKEAVK